MSFPFVTSYIFSILQQFQLRNTIKRQAWIFYELEGEVFHPMMDDSGNRKFNACARPSSYYVKLGRMVDHL